MTDLERLVMDLVAIDSTNPDLVPGSAGEAEIAGFIADWLTRAGLEVSLETSIPGRPTVIGIARGCGGGRSLMLNGHMDTVGAGEMDKPFSPYLREGRIYGRGSYDMKGGLAACMTAAAGAVKKGLKGDVIITAVADEEFAGAGTLAIADRYKADGAVVAEGTDEKLITAHKGFVWLEVETLGKAAHGSRPDLGRDAIISMGHLLSGLDRLNKRLLEGPVHPLLGTGSLHASLINGGQELSTYPEHCLLSLERRTLPGETPKTVLKELQELLAGIEKEDPSFKGEVKTTLFRGPMEIQPDSELVRFFIAASKPRLGNNPQIVGAPFWTDAASLFNAGTPAVLFGPSGAGAHAKEEWVDSASVQTCADIFGSLIDQFCGD